jgi:hypothetical protein
MMIFSRIAVIAASLVSAASIAPGQSASARAGCYDLDSLRLGFYSRPAGREARSQFRLIDEPRQPSFRVPLRVEAWPVTDSVAASMWSRFSGWEWRAPDSVYVMINSGLGGWRFEFRGNGDTLSGRWIEITDVVGGPLKTGQVRAIRAPCR